MYLVLPNIISVLGRSPVSIVALSSLSECLQLCRSRDNVCSMLTYSAPFGRPKRCRSTSRGYGRDPPLLLLVGKLRCWRCLFACFSAPCLVSIRPTQVFAVVLLRSDGAFPYGHSLLSTRTPTCQMRNCRSYTVYQVQAITERVKKTCEDVESELHRQIQVRAGGILCVFFS